MNYLDPTYLRYIYDGLIKGSAHSENESELPDGLIGLYEVAFEEHLPVLQRQQLLQRFALFALLKKEVSAAFVAEVLEESETDILEFINTYASWFNSPEPGKFQLYHERIKVYLLQKLSEKEIQTIHEKLITRLEKSIEEQQADEFEFYALEFLSEIILINSNDKNLYILNFILNDQFIERSFKLFNTNKTLINWINNSIIFVSLKSKINILQYSLKKIEIERIHSQISIENSVLDWLKQKILIYENYDQLSYICFLAAIFKVNNLQINQYKTKLIEINNLFIKRFVNNKEFDVSKIKISFSLIKNACLILESKGLDSNSIISTIKSIESNDLEYLMFSEVNKKSNVFFQKLFLNITDNNKFEKLFSKYLISVWFNSEKNSREDIIQHLYRYSKNKRAYIYFNSLIKLIFQKEKYSEEDFKSIINNNIVFLKNTYIKRDLNLLISIALNHPCSLSILLDSDIEFIENSIELNKSINNQDNIDFLINQEIKLSKEIVKKYKLNDDFLLRLNLKYISFFNRFGYNEISNDLLNLLYQKNENNFTNKSIEFISHNILLSIKYYELGNIEKFNNIKEIILDNIYENNISGDFENKIGSDFSFGLFLSFIFIEGYSKNNNFNESFDLINKIIKRLGNFYYHVKPYFFANLIKIFFSKKNNFDIKILNEFIIRNKHTSDTPFLIYCNLCLNELYRTKDFQNFENLISLIEKNNKAQFEDDLILSNRYYTLVLVYLNDQKIELAYQTLNYIEHPQIKQKASFEIYHNLQAHNNINHNIFEKLRYYLETNYVTLKKDEIGIEYFYINDLEEFIKILNDNNQNVIKIKNSSYKLSEFKIGFNLLNFYSIEDFAKINNQYFSKTDFLFGLVSNYNFQKKLSEHFFRKYIVVFLNNIRSFTIMTEMFIWLNYDNLTNIEKKKSMELFKNNHFNKEF